MKRVILKNGVKVRVSNKEAQLISNVLMNSEPVKESYCRNYVGDDLLSLFKLDEIVVII